MSAVLLTDRPPVAGAAALPRPARTADLAGTDELARRLDGHRRELVGHCRRILGSAADAEDAAQETLVRAWRHLDRFEQRSSLRTWLYRIATNVCVDTTRARARRALPVDLSPGASSGAGDGAAGTGEDWAPPDRTWRRDPSPEDAAESAEAVERAFVAALAHLPRRQRVALVLYDVFRWPAQDVADLLGTTPASVTSAVQRARATLAAQSAASLPAPEPGRHADLVDGYVDAFRRLDITALVALEGTAC